MGGTYGAPSTGNRFVTNEDPRLTNARNPTNHHGVHENGGADEIAAADLAVAYTPAHYVLPATGILGEHLANIDAALEVSGQIIPLVRNIQLLFLRLAVLDNVAFGQMVDGFFDAFEDQTGIDGSLTTGTYNAATDVWTPVEEAGGLVATTDYAADADIVREDMKGLAALWCHDMAYKGHFEGTEIALDAAAVTNEGGGKVGLPATAHGLTSGQLIRVYGTTNYNSSFTVDAASTLNKIVATATYAAENLTSAAKCRRRLSVGTGNACPLIDKGQLITFSDGSTATIAQVIDNTGASSGIRLCQDVVTGTITGITATKVVAGNVTINQAIDPDGTANASTVNKLPQMTSNATPSPYSVSASSEYSGGFAAWYAFNRAAGAWCSNAATNQWLEVNMGAGNAFAANRWRFKTNAGSDQPKRFRLEAYDGSQWIGLDNTYQNQDYTQVVAAYSAWFGFVNNVTYQRYRLYVFSSYGSYIALDELEIVEAQTVTPTAWGSVRSAPALQRDCASWQHISGVGVAQAMPGSSKAFHGVSFDGGSTWKVFLSGAWKDVVRNSAGTWQYRDGGSTWQNAAVNSGDAALRQAFGVTQNQWAKTDIEAMSQTNWEASGGFSTSITTVDWAHGLSADTNILPTLDKVTVTYAQEARNLVLCSVAVGAASVAARALVSVLVKNNHASLKAFISTANSPLWTELTGLTKVTDLPISVGQYASNQIAIAGSSDKAMRIKITADAGHGTEVHGYAVNWG